MKYKMLIGVMLLIGLTCPGQVYKRPLNKELKEKHIKKKQNSNTITIKKPSQVDKKLFKEALYKRKQDTIDIKGCPVAVKLDFFKQSTFEKLNDGSKIWSIKIEAPNAKYMILGFKQFEIPLGGELYIYDEKKTFLSGPYHHKNNQDKGRYYSDSYDCESLIIEYHEPRDITSKVSIIIDEIYYGYNNNKPNIHTNNNKTRRDSLSVNSTQGIDSYSCLVDIMCSQGADWQDEKKAVVIIEQLAGGWQPIGTGVLINNTSEDKTAYIYTARHVAPIVWNEYYRVKFNYFNTSCDGTNSTSDDVVASGIIREAFWGGSNTGDYELLRLTDPVPTDAYFAGWTLENRIPNISTFIHHPKGLEMKISQSSNMWLNSQNVIATYLHVGKGSAFGSAGSGSSGGPIFTKNHGLFGSLTFGNTTPCTEWSTDDYRFGRFVKSWNETDMTGYFDYPLSGFLDPSSENYIDGFRYSLDGIYNDCTPLHLTSVNSNINGCKIYIENCFLTSTRTIQSETSIHLDNYVNVYSGNITLKAKKKITLGREFKVEKGATFKTIMQ